MEPKRQTTSGTENDSMICVLGSKPLVTKWNLPESWGSCVRLRCGSAVERRLMPQWNIKITDYADRLIHDLKELDWPKQIKDAQINWIAALSYEH